jgi:hypothetical protein
MFVKLTSYFGTFQKLGLTTSINDLKAQKTLKTMGQIFINFKCNQVERGYIFNWCEKRK